MFSISKHRILALAAVVALLLIVDVAYGQCAMCKAVTESAENHPAERKAGQGINTGILYIMAIPYILIMTFVLIYFRKNVGDFARQLGLIR